MLNVAVSPAKDHFLVFGNLALFDAKRGCLASGILVAYLFEHAENELARYSAGWSGQATSESLPLAQTAHVW